MFGFCSDNQQQQQKPNILPSPLPQWPQGQGFATGTINLGELEVAMVKDFKHVNTYPIKKGCGVSFYKPVSIPDGFFSLGHYCQLSHPVHKLPMSGYVLVARNTQQETETHSPPLKLPRYYKLIWCSWKVFVWQPIPHAGYRALGFVVTLYDGKLVFPDLEEVRCVRDDLTEKCDAVIDREMIGNKAEFLVVNPKASYTESRKGVTVGTSYVITDLNLNHASDICCLKNMNPNLEAMPNLEQVEALLDHYGPTVYYHPNEVYLPSSVPWFFENGGLVYKKGGEFWLNLPSDDDTLVKHGNLKSAPLYAHVKPALGGTFTDINMKIFYPFNGPNTFTVAHLFNMNIEYNKHVGGWEHFTLRVSNFDGQLWGVKFSQNTAGGRWVNAASLEFIEGNKPIVYSSKCGHKTLPRAGTFIQGSPKLFGTGFKYIVDKSDMFIDASKNYQIVAAEYLGGVVAEPEWLQYMRKWGPPELYGDQFKSKEINSKLPFFIRMMIWLLIRLFSANICVKKRLYGPKDEEH